MMFSDALRAAGLLPRDVIADGKWHRCPTTDKPKKKNGAFLLTVDGQRGFFKNYATDLDFNVWQEDRPLTEAEKRKYAAQAKDIERRERAKRIEAMKAMRAHWLALPPLRGGHPYLEGKGLSLHGCEGLRLDGDKLVIPMMRAGYLQSLQTITPAGEKKYRAGCPVTGAAFEIHRPAATLTCFAEGFATGLAVFQCVTDARVVVCFDAGNLVRVAEAAKPRGLTVVCADNDWHGSTNTGIDKGQKAAELMRCGLSYPKDIKGTDFADALKEWGSTAKVKVEVMRGAKFVAAP
jgi:putative DNA primase/helicase